MLGGTAGPEQILVDVANKIDEQIVLVLEVAVKRPHRNLGLLGNLRHRQGDITHSGENLTGTIQQVTASALPLDRGRCGKGAFVFLQWLHDLPI